MKKWLRKLKSDFRNYLIFRSGRSLRREVVARDFSIICNNCWAGRIYQLMDLPYTTPFTGLYLFADDYIKLLSKLRENLALPLRFVTVSRHLAAPNLAAANPACRIPPATSISSGVPPTTPAGSNPPTPYSIGSNPSYPIGLLGDDIEIHFLHYHSEQEAREKWERRVVRINWDRLFISFSERDLCTPQHIAQFDALEFPRKVCFTANEYRDLSSIVWLKNYKGQGEVGDLYRDYKVVMKQFDIARWLNS